MEKSLNADLQCFLGKTDDKGDETLAVATTDNSQLNTLLNAISSFMISAKLSLWALTEYFH
jgi:hypothetical protein